MSEETLELEQVEKAPERVVRRVKKKTGIDIPWRDVTLILAVSYTHLTLPTTPYV